MKPKTLETIASTGLRTVPMPTGKGLWLLGEYGYALLLNLVDNRHNTTAIRIDWKHPQTPAIWALVVDHLYFQTPTKLSFTCALIFLFSRRLFLFSSLFSNDQRSTCDTNTKKRPHQISCYRYCNCRQTRSIEILRSTKLFSTILKIDINHWQQWVSIDWSHHWQSTVYHLPNVRCPGNGRRAATEMEG